jgi:hypothetical protein
VSVEIRLTDNIDAEIERIEGGAEHLVAQLAMRVRDVAKDNLHVGYGVDTGAMQDANPAQPFFTPALELVASEADNIARESFDLEGIHRT